MHYNILPGTNLKVSQLSLGTMMFGGQTGDADSLAIMDYAYDQGINVFDTANVYNQGESERLVGKGMKLHRQDIVLATKVGGRMGGGINNQGLSRRHIMEQAEASLRRLQTDYLDIYYMHFPDYLTNIMETMEAMADLVRAGRIRYIGISNCAAWQIADLLHLSEKCRFPRPIITQNVYNPITRGLESELLPFLKAHPMAMTIYNPIAGGLLAGKHKPGQPQENTRFANNPTYFDRYWSEENFKAVEKLYAVANKEGISLLELAMKWCVQQPLVTTVITGVSKLSQLQQNISVLEGRSLSPECMAACDEVWYSLAGSRFAYNR